MCFYIREGTAKQIATKDIVVYKVMHRVEGNKVKSPFMDYIYELYVHQPDVPLEPTDVGYPSLISNESWAGKIINKGYHSYSSRKEARLHRGDYCIVCEFVIPKGAEYWFDPKKKEYVSSTIILTKINPVWKGDWFLNLFRK